ncbi:SPOR domain-containing protein [Lacihabitans sp. LS3-19]|uniref:HU domain-containing protein n=1 Tax=Lacihabitans sp. LS3-19 TaxID=2487335 RepID=UPI0020CFB00F|nr:SPOR domain-containing protein [Lacihabitans sp. LS3-19]MCP9768198.1 SPOR domain-containing protein [Lacihabitans sp. LS3-19]
MFNIQKEIEQVIQNQDFIVLPNIGAFISEYSKPYFDGNQEIVLPIKKLEFNEVIDKDLDGKLIELIRQNSKLPEDLIKSEYTDFLKKFRAEIVLNKKFNWDGIGIFYRDEENKIVFFPETIEQKIEIGKLTEEPKKLFQIQERVSFHDIEEQEELEIFEKKRTYSKIFLYLIPLFLLSSILAYSIFIKPSQKKSEKKNMVEEIDSLANLQVKVLNDTSLSSQKLVISQEKKNEKLIEDKKTQKIKDNKSYVVSIGVFSKKENVDNLASYLAENGFPARVRPLGKKYKVYVVASSEAQALEYVDKIEQLTELKPVYENNN